LAAWAIAFGCFAFTYTILVISRHFGLKRLKVYSANTETLVDDLIYEIVLTTRSFFLFALSIYVSSIALKETPGFRFLWHRGFLLIFFLQAALWGKQGIDFWIEHYLKKRALSDAAAATSIGLINFSAKFGLFSILILLVVHNLGFDVTTLLAGLGVGGVAVALAVQNILGDLFASLSIVLDKPFVVGDFVVVADFMGTIEHIGVKTTRMRSSSGEQLIFSNGDLLRSRVRNYKRMTERRCLFTLGIVYQASPEQLAQIPSLVQKIISNISEVRFERCHFLRFGASTLEFEVVYWVKSPDYIVYADAVQKINLEIFRRFKVDGIEFAYPSQTLFVQGRLAQQEVT
jgi:small-conductance mechanosensitive channel